MKQKMFPKIRDRDALSKTQDASKIRDGDALIKRSGVWVLNMVAERGLVMEHGSGAKSGS